VNNTNFTFRYRRGFREKSLILLTAFSLFLLFSGAASLAVILNPVYFAITETKPDIVLVGKIPRTHGNSSKQIVPYKTRYPPGTIVISNKNFTLHLVLGSGIAAQYKISLGRDGFTWTGITSVGRKSEWPEWRPPAAMKKRDPGLPGMVPSGPRNPLGARAIYLFKNGRDTLYRIHGTNNSASIGGFETSGCFRLSNADVLELYGKVKLGSKVVVE